MDGGGSRAHKRAGSLWIDCSTAWTMAESVPATMLVGAGGLVSALSRIRFFRSWGARALRWC
jgi:hypothetical protein